MKVKLNNRGFAISTMIYSIFLIFLIFVSSLLALLAYRKNIFDAHKSAIYKESNKIPVVIVDNEDLSYEEKISFNLESGIKCTDCNIVSITLDDYEIPKEEYNNYLVNLTPGEYTFVYKISNGKVGNDEKFVTRVRKIKIAS